MKYDTASKVNNAKAYLARARDHVVELALLVTTARRHHLHVVVIITL
jgi:hypothetical protein